MLCSCIAVSAETVYRYGDWTLTAISGAGSYAFGLRSYEGENTAVTAPDNYGGYPIVEGDAEFVGCVDRRKRFCLYSRFKRGKP